MAARPGIGILSFAHGHVNAYAQRIATYDDARLVACWDDDESRGQRQAAAYGLDYSPHLEDVLYRTDVDCIIVASETNKHAELCIAAMEAGKDVFLQKPMAITLVDCDRIIATADKTGVWFSLAFQMRTDPQNMRMKELLESGAIGRVGFIRRRHCIPVLFNKAFIEGPTRWHISAEANKGMFFDDATHALDWLVWMLGRPPVSVMASVRTSLRHPAEAVERITGFVEQGLLEIPRPSTDDPLGLAPVGEPLPSLTRAAYQFAAAHEAVSTVLIGTGSADHLRANVADLLGPGLSWAQMAYLREAYGRLAWNA